MKRPRQANPTTVAEQASPEHRAGDLPAADIETAGKMTEALEIVEQARGFLHGFHRLTGSADLALDEVIDRLRETGYQDLAERIQTDLVGRNVLQGRWTFQIIEEYDDDYYTVFREAEAAVRDTLVDGKRHLAEARMKEERRTPGHPKHEARPTRSERTGNGERDS